MAEAQITQELLSRTPLYDLQLQQKARFTPFSGWEMPVQYSGITTEHQAVRNDCGMFDISHMGKFVLQGTDLIEQLQFLIPSDLQGLQAGKAQYSVLLNADGGIIDDIIFYYQGADDQGIQHGVLIVNAGTLQKDKIWLLSQLASSSVQLIDLSSGKLLIAVQGKNAVGYLQPLISDNLSQLTAFDHVETMVLEKPAFVARTGYTGEDGFEIMLDIETGQQLWQKLIDLGVTPCGLGARDTLRLEAGMCLYGQDVDDKTTPLDAGLNWLVHLDRKGDFIGRNVLESQKIHGVINKLVALEMQGRNIARHGYNILHQGEVVGIITSGTMSPTLGKAIALGYVPSSLGKIGQMVDVEIRGKVYPAKVVKKPFYRRKG
jgi:aminomethyltransferase